MDEFKEIDEIAFVDTTLPLRILCVQDKYRPTIIKLLKMMKQHYDRVKKKTRWSTKDFESKIDELFVVVPKRELVDPIVSRYYLKIMLDTLQQHEVVEQSYNWQRGKPVQVKVYYYKLLKKMLPFIPYIKKTQGAIPSQEQ